MFRFTYVYIVQKLASTLIPRHCHAHKVDTSPAFHKYLAEEMAIPRQQFLPGTYCVLISRMVC